MAADPAVTPNVQDPMALLDESFAAAQLAQAEITAATTNHKTVMSAYEAIKNAFQAIKG